MKKTLYIIGWLALTPFVAFGIAGLVALPVAKADGKTFYEIITNAELVLRFIAASIVFAILIYLFARFYVIKFFDYITNE